MYVCVCMYAHTNTCTWYIFACTCMFTYTSITTLFSSYYAFVWASQVAQLVKNPPAMQETPSSIPGLGSSIGEGIGYPFQSFQYSWASLLAQMVKNPPAMLETWFQTLSWEDPLEEGLETHSNILACRMPMDRGPWRLQSMGSQRVSRTD